MGIIVVRRKYLLSNPRAPYAYVHTAPTAQLPPTLLHGAPSPALPSPLAPPHKALSDAERIKFSASPSSLGLDLPFELKALEVCLDVVSGWAVG